MLKRLKHWLLGHEFYAGWTTTSDYETMIAFVCKCGRIKRVSIGGTLTLRPSNPATDSELTQLKKMAGIE